MRDLSQQECNRLTVARYWEEFWTKANPAVVDEVCSDDFSQFYPMHGRLSGKAEVKRMLANFKKSFPDISFRLLTPFPLIAEGDYVVARWFGGGTHTGEALFDLPVGSLPTPNTGKEIRFSGTTVFKLRDNKIVEEIGEESALVALHQLGCLRLNKGID